MNEPLLPADAAIRSLKRLVSRRERTALRVFIEQHVRPDEIAEFYRLLEIEVRSKWIELEPDAFNYTIAGPGAKYTGRK